MMGDEQPELLDLNEIMSRFGVHSWSALSPIETSQAGTLQVSVDIQGQRYFLRERPSILATEDTHFRPAFRSFLQQAGIPVPALWLTSEGESMVAIGDDAFELEEVVDGERFTSGDRRSLQWVAAAGSMLGQIHQASRRFAGPQQRWPSEAHIGGIVQGYLNLARNRAAQSEIAAVAAAIDNWCDAWEALLPSAMMGIGSARGLPEFHIHGDYHALNVRFAHQQVCAVLDWDAARWEKRLIELAAALFSFSALEWLPDTVLTRPLVRRGLDPERARVFLGAYGAIYAPVAGEAAVLGDALALVAPIATINGPLEDVFFTPQAGDESLIDDVMERLAWAISLPAWLGRVKRLLSDMWM